MARYEKHFTTNDEMVGQRVWIDCGDGEDTPATVIAVGVDTDRIKVRADEPEYDGEILIGNQWEPMD